LGDKISDILHGLDEEMDVVEGGENRGEDFTSLKKMTYIRPGIILTGMTGTVRVKWCEVFFVGGVFDNQFTL